MDWDDFASRLLRVLFEFGDRSYLVIVGADDLQFRVQFCVGEDVLAAQCNGALLSLGGDGVVEDRLLSLGWVDGRDPGWPCWEHDLELPASSAEYRRLVDDTVAVLRELFGVGSPMELGYQAWRNAELMVPDQVYSDEDLEELDPGENPLVLDLGIPYIPAS